MPSDLKTKISWTIAEWNTVPFTFRHTGSIQSHRNWNKIKMRKNQWKLYINENTSYCTKLAEKLKITYGMLTMASSAIWSTRPKYFFLIFGPNSHNFHTLVFLSSLWLLLIIHTGAWSARLVVSENTSVLERLLRKWKCCAVGKLIWTSNVAGELIGIFWHFISPFKIVSRSIYRIYN